jgi:hypothetical protein
MPASGRIEFVEAFRGRAGFAEQSSHLVIETHAQFWRDLGIIANRLGEFLVRFGMQQGFHSPAILRARARESSSGTP